jgi:hypothetical protein
MQKDPEVETFLTNLRGEIDIRCEYVDKIKSRASKIYLLIRNVGTLLTLFGFLRGIWFGVSEWLMSYILVVLLLSIWVNDFLDYSRVILSETQCIADMKEILLRTTLTLELTKIEDLRDFLASAMTELMEKRAATHFVPLYKSADRGEALVKKNV